METNCVDFVKSCHDCQTHANLNHVPPSELYNMTSPWPFLVWGIYMIGRIALKALNGHKYILVAMDYFTTWVEAASYSVLKAKHVVRFIESNIICRYGVLLGYMPLNIIVWRYVWHYLLLKVVINKVVLLLSKIMVTWIFGHYHIAHEMHNMWFSHRRYKSQVLCKLRILVRSRWWTWAFHLWRL